MRVFLAALVLSAPVFGQICDFNVSPTALSIPSTASTGTVTVTTACGGWGAVSQISWLRVTAGATGNNGSGTVTFSADANQTGFARIGTLSVAAKTVTITQAATVCTFDLAPKTTNVPVTGGTGSFALKANCEWNAFSNNGGILTMPNGGSRGISDATLSWTMAPNGCAYGRSANVVVNTNLLNPPSGLVIQDGSDANLSIGGTSANAGPDASDGRIAVTTGTGCSWGASSDSTWLQLTTPNGNGNGAITYHLLANSTAVRTGHIRIGSLTYTVTQAASGLSAPTIASVNSAASYKTDAISPGEIVTIFGANMGPSKIATLVVNNGSVTSELSGTQVLFDNTPAPMIYTLDKQVSAIVPYGVAGKASTQMQVVYNGQKSSAMTMPVQSAHPAIFTSDASGLGPGAILNQDNSINSTPNGAPRGSIIAIYTTGGGTTDPALSDGAVTGLPLPYLTAYNTGQVSVTIGGVTARVTYAGGVPGAVAGLTQVNAEVPAGVAPGVQPVLVRIGSYTSAAGVTVSVK